MRARHDALIVGGGPAGAAAALLLARAGRDVLLIEREPGPHDKVCGEFVSIEAQRCLEALDVDAPGLGAVALGRVRLSRGGRRAEAPLPFRALSLSRRVLDEALLERAGAAGARILRGQRAVRAAQAGGIWHVETDRGGRHAARALFLATGKHDLRGFGRPPGIQNDLIGLKMHLRRTVGAASADRVDLFLFDGGYGGLEPVEGGRVNLCLLVRRSRFAALGRSWEALVGAIGGSCPAVAAELADAAALWPRPLAIAAIPYGHVSREQGPDTLYRLGDQFAVVPSFLGDGMAVALYTAGLAVRAFVADEGARAYGCAAAQELGRAARLTTLLSLAAVRAPGQAAAMRAFALFPALLPALARRTRLGGRAPDRLPAGVGLASARAMPK